MPCLATPPQLLGVVRDEGQRRRRRRLPDAARGVAAVGPLPQDQLAGLFHQVLGHHSSPFAGQQCTPLELCMVLASMSIIVVNRAQSGAAGSSRQLVAPHHLPPRHELHVR